MSSNKFITIQSGEQVLLTAISTSAGVGDASKIVMTDGSGKLDTTLMPVGIGADTTVVNAGENLTAGNFVWINGSGLAMKADNTATKPAHGFVKSAVTSGQPATIYRSGTNSDLSGLTAGTEYVLGTAGGVVAKASAPTAAASIVQRLGVAHSTTELNFDARNYIING